jgi:hypothetical protein
MKVEYRNVTIDGDLIRGEQRHPDFSNTWGRFEASKNLFRIHHAVMLSDEASARIWDEQDGYGEAGYTPVQGWDWSGIRDSSDEAKERMEKIAREYVDDFRLARILGVNHL